MAGRSNACHAFRRYQFSVDISKVAHLRDTPLALHFSHIWPMALIAVVTLSAEPWLYCRRSA